MPQEENIPVWAREDAMPPAGPGEWGWVDRKGKVESFSSMDELEQAIIRDAGARIDLVWTPASPYLVVPEEIPQLHRALKEARLRWADWEIGEGKTQTLLFLGVIAIMLVIHRDEPARLLKSPTMGIALLLMFIFGLLPWHQGRKRRQRARLWAAGEMAEDATELRFETWLDHQKAPYTDFLIGAITLVGIAQLLCRSHGSISVVLPPSIAAAGLLKTDHHATDWWRLFTAPFLHGHPIHWLMNVSSLRYLGKRLECFARWPHLLLVFIFSAWLGGEASCYFVAQPSIGASGGIMGVLGFLLVFEFRHRALIPQSSSRRLLAGLFLTLGIGVVGFHFIDNAAHIGGLLAGVVYAIAMFPASVSARRPQMTFVDRVLGVVAVAVVALTAVFAIYRIFFVKL
jgi:membrane associated rhomboid family serine protease